MALHLIGRLDEAFKVALANTPAAVEPWKLERLESDDAIDTIEAPLNWQLPILMSAETELLKGHHTYVAINKNRMRYATVRKASLPIGSGVTESTAQNVVNMRTKRSGQR